MTEYWRNCLQIFIFLEDEVFFNDDESACCQWIWVRKNATTTTVHKDIALLSPRQLLSEWRRNFCRPGEDFAELLHNVTLPRPQPDGCPLYQSNRDSAIIRLKYFQLCRMLRTVSKAVAVETGWSFLNVCGERRNGGYRLEIGSLLNILHHAQHGRKTE